MTTNNDALPRAFLATNYIVETDPQKILVNIFDPNIDLSKTVILEEEPNIKIASGQAKMTTYEPTKVVVNTNSSENNLLFLSDNYYPGWKAYLNNIETKIYRADFSFRAVPVPAGDNTVIFQYDPMSLKIGAIISILTLCGLALLFYLRRYLRS